MAPHSSTLAWKIPWMEEPGRLQSMGSLRVGRDWATSLSCLGEGNGNPLHYSCLENPRDRGAWWAAIYGVTQSRTWLTWQQQQEHYPAPFCRFGISAYCRTTYHSYISSYLESPYQNPHHNIKATQWPVFTEQKKGVAELAKICRRRKK